MVVAAAAANLVVWIFMGFFLTEMVLTANAAGPLRLIRQRINRQKVPQCTKFIQAQRSSGLRRGKSCCILSNTFYESANNPRTSQNSRSAGLGLWPVQLT